MADVKIPLEILDKAANKTLDDLQKKADATDKSFKKMGDSGSSAFRDITLHIGKATGVYEIFQGNLLANLAVKGIELVTDAAKELFNVFVIEGVHAAAEAEANLNQLNVAIAQSGHYSQQASEDFQKFAESLQETTGVEDDVIIKNAALLEGLTQLDGKGLQKATSAALDLSAALGRDLNTTIEALGKAANGNVTALQKMGIEVRKGATDAQTLDNAIKAINDRFGGSAAKQLNTFEGAIKLVGATFNDLQEAIGNTIVKNEVIVSVIKTVGQIFGELKGSIDSNRGSLKTFIAEGVIATADALLALVTVLDVLVKAGTSSFELIKASVYGFGAAVTGVLSVFSSKFDQSFKEFTAAADASMKAVGTSLTEDSKLGEVATLLARVGNSAKDSFAQMGDSAKEGADGIEYANSAVVRLTDAQKKFIEETYKSATALAEQGKSAKEQLDKQIADAELAKEQQNLLDADNKVAQLANEQAFLEQKAALEDQYFAGQITRQEQARALDIENATTYNAAIANLEAQRATASIKNNQKAVDAKRKQNEQEAADRKASLSYISTLQQESSKELFAIGKAAALAVAYIDGQAAVMKALSAAPPPFNFALAALVGVAAAANLARIASAQPPGFEDGGIVPGNSFSGDNVSAQVNSGEMILNRNQQTRLFQMANGDGSSSGKLDMAINLLTQVLSQPITVNVSGKELFTVIRTEIDGGRSFA